MTKNYKIKSRRFDGEHKIGVFEIIILGIFIFFVACGIYYFGGWFFG
jgi:hypothetical protein